MKSNTLPAGTIQVTKNGRDWVAADKLKPSEVRYAIDDKGQRWRAKKMIKVIRHGDPRHTFAKVCKAHIDTMVDLGVFQ